MYCKTCEAEVAAEVSADGKSLLCTTCGSEVRKSYAPSLSDEARSARELLERWSSEEEPDPFASHKKPAGDSQRRTGQEEQAASKRPADSPKPSSAKPEPPHVQPPYKPGIVHRADAGESLSGPKIRRRPGSSPPRDRYDEAESGNLLDRPQRRPSRPEPTADFAATDEAVSRPSSRDEKLFEPASPARGRTAQSVPKGQQKVFRVDAAHTRTVSADDDGPTIPPPHRRPAPSLPDGHRVDARHGIPAPHMRTESFVPDRSGRPGRVESMAGQLLAYGGVGLLTVGTALILWGYFGGPVQYAPTGWLVATVGQMILFLGVVTLISGGMQQTTHEVGQHVAHLGERLGRIEETTEMALNGPHYMSRRTGASRQAAGVQTERRDADQAFDYNDDA